jgi:proline dehydrogenase
MGLARSVLIAASKNRWMRERLPQFGFAKRAVMRFMPGEKAGDALQAAKRFQPEHISVVITYLGENVKDAAEAHQITRHYCDVLEQIRRLDVDCEISVKLTQLGHDISPEVSYANVKTIIESARDLRNFVWIDMEETKYVDSTLDLYRRLRQEFENVGVCLQAYLYRTAADLESLLPLKPGIRLVKGAYREPPNLAFPKKKDVDENYLRLSVQLLEAVKANGTRVAFATHDQKLIESITRAARERDIPDGAYEIQMLYGIRTGTLRHLVTAGHRGRILISYGPAWYPWYMRRLAERPANVLFVLRHVFG